MKYWVDGWHFCLVSVLVQVVITVSLNAVVGDQLEHVYCCRCLNINDKSAIILPAQSISLENIFLGYILTRGNLWWLKNLPSYFNGALERRLCWTNPSCWYRYSTWNSSGYPSHAMLTGKSYLHRISRRCEFGLEYQPECNEYSNRNRNAALI